LESLEEGLRRQGESGMQIREMSLSDVEFAYGLVSEEGWASETREVFETLLEYDPAGCFVAEDDSGRAGMCVAVRYTRSGFFGELIVKRDARGKGYGTALFRKGIDYLRSKGIKSISLDAEEAAAPIYEKEGFRKICRSLRFIGRAEAEKSPFVRRARPEDIGDILAIDRRLFGDDRSFFIRKRMALFPGLCYVLDKGGIGGYAMGRPGVGLVSVGPFACTDVTVDPMVLIRGLAAGTGGSDLRFGVLERFEEAAAIFRGSRAFREMDPCWRMAYGPCEEPCCVSGGLFAIGSGAKG
jgi:ribosomal protein S18 acetylase RimI-like enzyme